MTGGVEHAGRSAMRTYRLKICDLDQFGDMLVANDVLLNYISSVFAKSSRRVTPDEVVQLR